MRRSEYHQPIPQCQAMTQKKKRCTRDATHMQGNASLCDLHADIARRKISAKGYSPHPEEFVTKGVA